MPATASVAMAIRILALIFPASGISGQNLYHGSP